MDATFRIFTFLGLAVSLAAAQINLTIEPLGETHTRALGTSIVFTCTAIGLTQDVDPRLEWYDQEGQPVTDRTGRGDEDYSRVYIEYDTDQERRLYITDIRSEDAGRYMCSGTLEGNFMTRETRVVLFKDITFEHVPNPQDLILHRDGLVECRVSGQPVPTVSWRYRGKKVYPGGRYAYDEEGLRVKNATHEDYGDYTCRAEVASDGRLKEKIIKVTITVPPKIIEGIDEQEGIEDQEVSLTCKASGDPAPKYEFEKLINGAPVPITPTERIHLDPDNGAIHFRPLKKADEGNYRCTAINAGGDAVSEGFLKVIVPPRIIDLKNVTKQEGNEAQLQCVVIGDPTPTITFKKEGASGAYQEGDNEGSRIVVQRVADNALNLLVKNLSPDDTANYTCEVINVGGEYRQNGTITVEYKPRFDADHPALFYAWPGKTRNMTCFAQGEPEPVVDWYLHDQNTPLRDNFTYRVYKMGRNSVLQVKVRDEDLGWIYGPYTCRAQNKYGPGEIEIELQKASAPGKPKAAEVKEESPTMVILSVLPPDYDGGITILGYRVDYESRSQDFRIAEEIRIENLKPSTNYIFRIRAKNEVGVGNYLQYTHTTESIRNPYPIVIVSEQEGEFPYSFVVKWEKPRTGGLPIKEYEFKYRRVAVNDGSWEFKKPLEDWTRLVVQEDISRPRQFYKLENLQPNSYYELQVMARNDIDASAPNPQFIFRTADGEFIEPTDTSLSNNDLSPNTKDGRDPGAVVGAAAYSQPLSLLVVTMAIIQALL